MNIGVFDTGLFWRHWGANPNPIDCTSKIISELGFLSRQYDLFVIADDCPPYERSNRNEAYKANRKPKDEAALQCLLDLRERWAEFGLLLRAPGYEADDVAAAVVRISDDEDPFSRVSIHTNDKDLYPLISYRVNLWIPQHPTAVDEEECVRRFGVTPGKMFDLLCLMGDVSDNVPGIPGIGIKLAGELLRQFGSLEEVLKQSPAELGSIKGLGKAKVEAIMSYDPSPAEDMIRLCDELEFEEFRKRVRL